MTGGEGAPVGGPLAWLLSHGSYPAIFLALLASGVGIPFPEDLALLGAGVLAHRGVTSLPATVAVCFVGVLLGDFILFAMARRYGGPIYERSARYLTPGQRAWIVRVYERYGALAIVVGRHAPGLRGAIFALAAIHRMTIAKFLLWDTASLCLSAPIVIGLGYVFSDSVDRVASRFARAEHYALIALVGAVAAYLVVAWWRARRRV